MDLNCIGLGNPDCLGHGFGASRFPLDDELHALDPVKYYIVRPSGTPFRDWGWGNIMFDGNPWLRVVGTTPTSPGIDACLPMP